MPTEKITVEITQRLLREVDRWVASGEFSDRSQAVQAALSCLVQQRSGRGALQAELARLDPAEERLLADEALRAEVPWPDY